MICKVEIREELQKSLDAGMMSDRFWELCCEIFTKYSRSFSMSGFPQTAIDDFRMEFDRRIQTHWQKLDPKRNPFAAVNQQARWAKISTVRKFKARMAREQLYSQSQEI